MTFRMQPSSSRPVVLAIGGSDSAGMAGIQADLRTIHALGAHGATVITAVTAQHSGAVLGINPVAGEVLVQQLEATRALSPQSVKIGLLANAEQVRICARFIRSLDGSVPVVFDPVLTSSSGAVMTEAEAATVMREELLPLCTLVTPNRAEAEQLIGQVLPECPDKRLEIVRRFRDSLITAHADDGPAVLLTGGHWQESCSHDLLSGVGGPDNGQHFWLTSLRIDTPHQRGTGCTLASAVATAFAEGYRLADAVVVGKMTVNQGLRQGYGCQTDRQVTAGPIARQSQGPLQVAGFPTDGRDLPWLSATLPFTDRQDSFPDCGPQPLGLYPVVDRAHWLETLLPTGISTIQLRVKDLEGEALRDELARAIAIANHHQARLFINDHWQLAIELGAYGVHLGQEDLDSADIGAIRAAGLRLGISTHCHYEVARAICHRPSYIACGPVYPTTSKDMPWRPHEPTGLAYWRAVLPDYPLVAIGGIGREQLAAVSAVGPDGIAMITGLTLAADPAAAARDFMALLASCAPDRFGASTQAGPVPLKGAQHE